MESTVDRENTTPIYFVSPTPYNLLGIDEWVGGFRYITYFDSFDGAHARKCGMGERRCADSTTSTRHLQVGSKICVYTNVYGDCVGIGG